MTTGIPLRVRVTLASAAGAAVILAALSFFVYARLQAELVRAVDGGLQARAQAVASGIGRGRLSGLDVPDSGPGGVTQVLTVAGRLVTSRGTRVTGLPVPALRGIHEPSFLTLAATAGRAPLRVFVLPDPEGRRLFVVTGSTMAAAAHTLASLRLLLVTAGPAALALACLASWLLAGAALRPVERMRREAATISVSEPARRLPVPAAHDEVARLGHTLNSLLDRLQAAIDREQRLLDDASHELRTPLSILKATAARSSAAVTGRWIWPCRGHGSRRNSKRRCAARRKRPTGWRGWPRTCSCCPGCGLAVCASAA